MVPTHPDSDLVFPAGHHIVSPWPWIVLQVQNGSRRAKERLVVQLEEFALRGTPEANLKHDAA